MSRTPIRSRPVRGSDRPLDVDGVTTDPWTFVPLPDGVPPPTDGVVDPSPGLVLCPSPEGSSTCAVDDVFSTFTPTN